MPQEQKQSKIIGSGRSYKKQVVSLCLEDLKSDILFNHTNGKTYVSLEIIEKAEKDKYGSNVYVKQLDANPKND